MWQYCLPRPSVAVGGGLCILGVMWIDETRTSCRVDGSDLGDKTQRCLGYLVKGKTVEDWATFLL